MVCVYLILQKVGTLSLREVKWLYKVELRCEPALPDTKAMSVPLCGCSCYYVRHIYNLTIQTREI